MTHQGTGIVHKHLGNTLVATVRKQIGKRSDLHPILQDLSSRIPAKEIAGPAFCVYQFVSSVKEGNEVDVGFPVNESFQAEGIRTWTMPPMEVLSRIHEGPIEALAETYSSLYAFTRKHALISDEFLREIYLDRNDPEGRKIELQFVIHNWYRLLDTHVERVLGASARRHVLEGVEAITIDTDPVERFLWVKGTVERLERLADANQRYDIVSRCAHVFPVSQINKLRAVYEEKLASGADPETAIEAVMDFMEQDPCWGYRPRREGKILFTAKKPRDAEGYKQAKSRAERRRAFCFCPLIRERLDDGMPESFCHCGAGWFRQQWEGITGKPVLVENLQTVLRGDDLCKFAIHLANDLW